MSSADALVLKGQAHSQLDRLRVEQIQPDPRSPCSKVEMGDCTITLGVGNLLLRCTLFVSHCGLQFLAVQELRRKTSGYPNPEFFADSN